MLRPGFVEMLRPGGTVLLADTRILPYGMKGNAYPAREAIKAGLKDYKVLILDVLKTAMALGDASGQTANVVMMGALSRLAPFDGFPEAIWLQALSDVSPTPAHPGRQPCRFQSGSGAFLMEVSIDYEAIDALFSTAQDAGRNYLFEYEVYTLLGNSGAETPPQVHPRFHGCPALRRGTHRPARRQGGAQNRLPPHHP